VELENRLYLTTGSDINRLFWGVFTLLFGVAIAANGRGEKMESQKDFYIITAP